jgi:hypothetical protein
MIYRVLFVRHKRPFGDNRAAQGSVEMRQYNRAYYQYHHFHFDLDDVVLDQTGEWVHPVSTYASHHPADCLFVSMHSSGGLR